MAPPASSSAPAVPAKSEDLLSAKTDLCLSNGLVKAAIGLGAGVVASAILFRRRPWPVFVGLGFGLGQGYSDCERVFNPAAIPGFKIAGTDANAGSSFTPSTPSSSPSPSAVASKAKEDAKLTASQLATSAKSTAAKVETKAHDLVDQAKAKFEEVKAKAEVAKEEVKGEVKKGLNKDDKKWV